MLLPSENTRRNLMSTFAIGKIKFTQKETIKDQREKVVV